MRRIVWLVAVAVLVVGAAIATPVLRPALRQSIWPLLYAYRWWIPAAMLTIAAVLLGWLLAAFLRQPSGSAWRNNVLVAAKALEHRLNTLAAEGGPADPRLRSSVDSAVRDHLRAARDAATPTDPPPSLGAQLTGGPATPSRRPTSTCMRPRSPLPSCFPRRRSTRGSPKRLPACRPWR